MARRHDLPWQPSDEDGAIAARLGLGAAFVPGDGEVWWVRGGVLALATAVWERAPRSAHAVLRRRIRTTSPLSDVDRAAVAVLAKRATRVAPSVGPSAPLVDLGPVLRAAHARVADARVDPGVVGVPRDAERWIRELVPTGARGPRATRDRPVVAVLVAPDGSVRGAARNLAGSNRALHAELNLATLYEGSWAGHEVWTSLQPCRMCAAVIVERGAAGPVQVKYLERDPGRLARGTALQRLAWERSIAGDAP